MGVVRKMVGMRPMGVMRMMGRAGMIVVFAAAIRFVALKTVGPVSAVSAAVAFQQGADARHAGAGQLVDEAEDFRLKAEIIAQRERDLRVLALQALDLRLDAFDQHAGE